MSLRHSHLPLALLAVMAALAGCNADRMYEEDAAAYQLALGIEPSVPPLPDNVAITLRDALVLTNQHNERLAIEGENYAQAIIEKQRRIAEFLPTLTLAPSYVRRSADVPGNGSRDIFDVPLIGEINLFNGYRDVAALYSNASTIEQRRAVLLNTQSIILLETAFSFYNALRLERSVEVLQSTVTLQDERVRDIRKRRESGLARPLEVSQAEAQVADTKVQLIAAQNAVRNARTALRLLTAQTMATRPLTDELTPPATVDAMDAWQKIAALKRHDILAADKALESARHDVDNAFGQYYPSVTLNLEYVLTLDNTSTVNQWNAILRANVPIFTAGRIEADVRTAWSRVRQAFLDSTLTRRQVIADVEQAHHEFTSAGEQIAELQRRVNAGELALRQAEASYDAGLATNLDRLVAQDELLSARLDLITQSYTRKFAYLALLRAAGRLQEETKVGAVAPSK